MQVLLQILTLLGAVTLFLFGLKLLSGGLQKVAGDGLRSFLASMTSNPFKQIITGIGVTAVTQSSTATTIMVVSFVNAGLLVLGQALGVIMGANIGTTVTSWIMAVFGFSFNMADFAFPLILLGFVLMQFKGSQKRKDIGEIIIGFALFFVGFAKLRETAQILITPESLGFLQSWTQLGAGSIFIFLLIGIILTVCFQSSAATMAIIMILVTTGVIPFRLAAAMILGENVGTTIAANIAATVGNTAAKRTAISHTVFNLFGVFWVLCLFPLFLRLVGSIVTMFGLPDPNTADLTDASNYSDITTSLLYSVCTMHTLFNVINTLLLVWFIPQIARLVTMLLPTKEEEEIYRLKYISGGPLSTAELSLEEAKQEIIHLSELCGRDLSFVREAIGAKDAEQFAKMDGKLAKYETITDKIEYEIASYLGEVSKGEISATSGRRIKAMYRVIGELESIGDSGEAIGRILRRAHEHDQWFGDEMIRKLDKMVDLVEEAYAVLVDNLKSPQVFLKDISPAVEAECNINEYRDFLREEHIANCKKADYYQAGVFYIDIVQELEKVGDFIINVSQCQLESKG
ncbi:MAG: Na/Pi cotransporter family protein [Bacteroidales bacterium]|nr:Na/Pi cotransporter family protein [Bacteroidales bacterium]